MNTQHVRSNSILPFATVGDVDLTGKEGYLVKADTASGRVALLTSASDIPIGVLMRAAPPGEKNSVAVAFGGLAGTVRVKLGADVAFGQLLKTRADATVEPFTEASGEVFVGRALESGVAGELVEAALSNPYPA